MSAQRSQIALTGLQWTLGLAILIEAILFVLPSAAHSFAQSHMPNIVRLVLGFGEIAGCVLMLNPRTAIRGAWVLVAVFVLAIVIHLLHGMYEVGNLAIYTAAAWAVAVGKDC
jgi:cell division protein FtsW (lipid II flippase)